MRKSYLVGVVSLLLVVSLTGCSSGNEEINNLNSMSALNTESSVTKNKNLSWTDEQNMVYAQVSSRQLLDLSTLEACSDSEVQQVRNFMDSIDNQLIGQIDVMSYTSQVEKFITQGLVEDNAVIDTYMTDYLLTFFEKTPYYWQRYKTTIRGIDPGSRSIVVDVAYKTINFAKTIKADSTITRGCPDYDRMLQIRFNKYVDLLDLKLNNPQDPTIPELEANFIEYYGDPMDIINEQRVVSNTEDIFESGNQHTYNGLIDSEAENTGATCTVRYILTPDYALGINLGLTCTHLYITDFRLDTDVTEGMGTFTAEGYATVTDEIYSLIYSYFTCMDESDFNGLYKLTNNFQTLDKYYQDVFDSTYQKHDGFSVSLFDITGTHIKCGVTISTKERAKNSNMTFPIYTDRYYVEIELVDDVLKVNNLVHLSRTLEGEPDIDTDEAETSGFSAIIDLDNDDRMAIEDLICNLSALQLLGDVESDNFSNIVDISVSSNQLAQTRENIMSLSGVQKVVFLKNYQQGTSNYASVRCREMFQDENNGIVEADVTYEFILKGNRWYVYSYSVNSSVKLDTTNLATSGSLCLVVPGEVKMHTSQVQNTQSTSVDEVSDKSVSFDHEEYTPVLKTTVAEQGYRKMQGADLTAAIFDEQAANMGLNYTYQEFTEFVAQLNEMNARLSENEGYVPFDTESFNDLVLDGMAVIYNVNNGRYSDEEKMQLTTRQDFQSALREANDFQTTLMSEDASLFKAVVEILQIIDGRLSSVLS